jgi:hypothetical protein
MLQDVNYRIVKYRNYCDLWAGLQETERVAETSAQLGGRLQEQPRLLRSSERDLVP